MKPWALPQGGSKSATLYQIPGGQARNDPIKPDPPCRAQPTAPPFGPGADHPLEPASPGHGNALAVSDHQMIQQADIQQPQSLLQALGHQPVGLAGLGDRKSVV